MLIDDCKDIELPVMDRLLILEEDFKSRMVDIDNRLFKLEKEKDDDD